MLMTGGSMKALRDGILIGVDEESTSSIQSRKRWTIVSDGVETNYHSITIRANYETDDGNWSVTEVNTFTHTEKEPASDVESDDSDLDVRADSGSESDDSTSTELYGDAAVAAKGGCCKGEWPNYHLKGGSMYDLREEVLASLTETDSAIKSEKTWTIIKGGLQQDFKQTRLVAHYESSDGLWNVAETDIFTYKRKYE